MLSWQPSSPPRSSRPIPLPVPTGCFEPPETPLSLSVARVNRLTLCITKHQTGSTIATQDSPSHRRYSTEIVTTAEAIGPSWLREIWICGIDPHRKPSAAPNAHSAAPASLHKARYRKQGNKQRNSERRQPNSRNQFGRLTPSPYPETHAAHHGNHPRSRFQATGNYQA